LNGFSAYMVLFMHWQFDCFISCISEQDDGDGDNDTHYSYYFFIITIYV